DERVDSRVGSDELVRPNGAVVVCLDRLACPAGRELIRLHLAHRLLDPAGGVRDEVLVRPAARRRLAEPGATALADGGAERLPYFLDSIDKVGGGSRERALYLTNVLG